MMSKIVTEEVPTKEPQEPLSAPDTNEGLARQRAIKQIQRRRRFQMDLSVSAIVMALLVAIWAIAEYQNAGGWPTNGFSQSSSIYHVWNYWIIYPFMAWVLFLAVRIWTYYKGTSISESEVQREIERQTSRR